MARILLVDDEPQLCRILSLVLTERGHSVEAVGSGASAIEAAKLQAPDLVVVDVGLPGLSGIDVFLALRNGDHNLPGIFITANGSIPSAIAAMRAGGFDYLTKPFDNEHFVLTVDRALELRRLSVEVGYLKEELNGRSVFVGLIGNSPGIRAALRLLPKIAASDVTVLISGESGTGKELVARSIHRHSRRVRGPFVPVNCSAIPTGLVESEFFGHERGSFTDAKDSRVGRFEQAHGGTLFLDEIGDLPLESQAKLLRVLEDREVTRVGSRKPIAVDVRVVAATNRDLEDAVRRRLFREDLYWRLNVVPVRLPPLRDRRDDIPMLIDYFIDRLNTELGTSVSAITPDALARLVSHMWPGNVRELENTLKRLLILAEAPTLKLGDLDTLISRPSQGAMSDPDHHGIENSTLASAVARATIRVERALIEATLAQHRGSRTSTAEALGINRKTLFNKMKSYAMIDGTQDDDLS